MALSKCEFNVNVNGTESIGGNGVVKLILKSQFHHFSLAQNRQCLKLAYTSRRQVVDFVYTETCFSLGV